MNEDLHSRLRQEDLAFFGMMGAEVSHEMRNVLSIISEYAGLLDDLLRLAEKGKALDHVRLKKLSANYNGGKPINVIRPNERAATAPQRATSGLTAGTTMAAEGHGSSGSTSVTATARQQQRTIVRAVRRFTGLS